MIANASGRDSRQPVAWPYIVSGLLSLVGLADSIYLTVQHLTGESLRCTIISGCSEVLGSSYAQIGSVPLAGLGAVAYLTVFSLATLGAFGYAFVGTLLRVVVAMMFVTSLWLLYLQAFVIKHFCQYCLISAAVTIALTIIVFVAARARQTW